MEKLNFAEKFSIKSTTEISEFLENLLFSTREILQKKIATENSNSKIEIYDDEISNARFSAKKLLQILRETLRARKNLAENANRKLLLENLFLKI